MESWPCSPRSASTSCIAPDDPPTAAFRPIVGHGDAEFRTRPATMHGAGAGVMVVLRQEGHTEWRKPRHWEPHAAQIKASAIPHTDMPFNGRREEERHLRRTAGPQVLPPLPPWSPGAAPPVAPSSPAAPAPAASAGWHRSKADIRKRAALAFGRTFSVHWHAGSDS